MAKRKAEEITLDTQGQVTAPLDGTEFVLRPSFKAIATAERETGLTLFDLATQAANGRMSLDTMGIVVAAMMRAHGEACPDDPLKSSYLGARSDRCSELIFEAGAPKIMARLTIVLAGALSGGYTPSGEMKAAKN